MATAPITYGFSRRTQDPIDSTYILSSGNPWDSGATNVYTAHRGMQVFSFSANRVYTYIGATVSQTALNTQANWASETVAQSNETITGSWAFNTSVNFTNGLQTNSITSFNSGHVDFSSPIILHQANSDPSLTTGGAVYYNQSSNQIRYYNGSSWGSLLTSNQNIGDLDDVSFTPSAAQNNRLLIYNSTSQDFEAGLIGLDNIDASGASANRVLSVNSSGNGLAWTIPSSGGGGSSISVNGTALSGGVDFDTSPTISVAADGSNNITMVLRDSAVTASKLDAPTSESNTSPLTVDNGGISQNTSGQFRLSPAFTNSAGVLALEMGYTLTNSASNLTGNSNAGVNGSFFMSTNNSATDVATLIANDAPSSWGAVRSIVISRSSNDAPPRSIAGLLTLIGVGSILEVRENTANADGSNDFAVWTVTGLTFVGGDSNQASHSLIFRVQETLATITGIANQDNYGQQPLVGLRERHGTPTLTNGTSYSLTIHGQDRMKDGEFILNNSINYDKLNIGGTPANNQFLTINTSTGGFNLSSGSGSVTADDIRNAVGSTSSLVTEQTMSYYATNDFGLSAGDIQLRATGGGVLGNSAQYSSMGFLYVFPTTGSPLAAALADINSSTDVGLGSRIVIRTTTTGVIWSNYVAFTVTAVLSNAESVNGLYRITTSSANIISSNGTLPSTVDDSDIDILVLPAIRTENFLHGGDMIPASLPGAALVNNAVSHTQLNTNAVGPRNVNGVASGFNGILVGNGVSSGASFDHASFPTQANDTDVSYGIRRQINSSGVSSYSLAENYLGAAVGLNSTGQTVGPYQLANAGGTLYWNSGGTAVTGVTTSTDFTSGSWIAINATGTVITTNPAGAATQDLTKLNVNATIFRMALEDQYIKDHLFDARGQDIIETWSTAVTSTPDARGEFRIQTNNIGPDLANGASWAVTGIRFTIFDEPNATDDLGERLSAFNDQAVLVSIRQGSSGVDFISPATVTDYSTTNSTLFMGAGVGTNPVWSQGNYDNTADIDVRITAIGGRYVNGGDIANGSIPAVAIVDDSIGLEQVDDAAIVTIAGTQTISGTKSFSNDFTAESDVTLGSSNTDAAGNRNDSHTITPNGVIAQTGLHFQNGHDLTDTSLEHLFTETPLHGFTPTTNTPLGLISTGASTWVGNVGQTLADARWGLTGLSSPPSNWSEWIGSRDLHLDIAPGLGGNANDNATTLANFLNNPARRRLMWVFATATRWAVFEFYTGAVAANEADDVYINMTSGHVKLLSSEGDPPASNTLTTFRFSVDMDGNEDVSSVGSDDNLNRIRVSDRDGNPTFVPAPDAQIRFGPVRNNTTGAYIVNIQDTTNNRYYRGMVRTDIYPQVFAIRRNFVASDGTVTTTWASWNGTTTYANAAAVEALTYTANMPTT